MTLQLERITLNSTARKAYQMSQELLAVYRFCKDKISLAQAISRQGASALDTRHPRVRARIQGFNGQDLAKARIHGIVELRK